MRSFVKKSSIFLITAVVFFSLLSASNSYISTQVLRSDNREMVIRVSFKSPLVVSLNGFKKITFPLEGTTRAIGKPELPSVTRLIAIPDMVSCRYQILDVKSYTLSDMKVLPYNRGTDYERVTFSIDEDFYGRDVWYPHSRIMMGKPSIMRDFRIVPLTIFPVSYNPQKMKATIISEIKIKLSFSYTDASNKKIRQRQALSKGFVPLYEKFILNYGRIAGGKREERGSYLIIIPDALYDNILSFAEWKNRKGNRTTVKKLSEIGSTSYQIKDYILNAYNTWQVPPDYVLLVGDVGGTATLPTFYGTDPRHGTYATDLPYSQLEGNDLFPDIHIGRISVDNTYELDVIVSKIFGYERTPHSPLNWLHNFLCVSGQDFNSQPETKRWVQELVQGFGYNVDTLFAHNGADSTMISNAINNGRGFVNYRGGGWAYGWREPRYDRENILYKLNNGWKLPVLTSMNCGSGKFNYGSGESFGEIWLREGTPTTPKGGVAFIGATHWTYSSRNNAFDVGMYRAIFNDSINVIGQVMNAGKLFMYNCYPADMDTNVVEYGVYHVLGDPELNMWTDIPESLNVNHPSSVPVGNVGFEVTIRDTNDNPVSNCLVCLYKENEVYSYHYSNNNGKCYFLIEPTTVGTLSVTVTGLNWIPYENDIPVTSNNLYVGYINHYVDDDNVGGSSGNGDLKVNPGETIELSTVLKNFGGQTSYNVSGLLKTTNPLITLTDTVENFGDIPPGDTALCDEDFDFVLSHQLRYPDTVDMHLYISDNDSTWYSYFAIPIFACEMSYEDFTFLDGGNGEPEPGETANLTVTLSNQGSASANNLTAILKTEDPYISVNDSMGEYGDISPGENGTNGTNRFDISISPDVYTGHKSPFLLYLTTEDYYTDTLEFQITIAPVSNGSPSGPDEYGYYAYDINDVSYTEAPVYNWIEIDPGYGGTGTLIELGEDYTKSIHIPFTFKYYGINYDSISICSNGWISAGKTNIATYTNWPIPDTYGPKAMIAPFWDDLSDSLPSPHHVYYKYDSSNHRFIVEWSRIYHTYADSIPHPADPETFEAILYDPQYYPTTTGDGEIICQYKAIIYPLSSTIGIENKDETIGLQYIYNGELSPGASTIDDGMAVKFTTDPPQYTGIKQEEIIARKIPFVFSAYPNPFYSETNIVFVFPHYKQKDRGKNKNPSPELNIYDVAGRWVKRLAPCKDGDTQFPIFHYRWNGKDGSGVKVGSGIYILKMEYDTKTVTSKLIKIMN